MPRPPQVPACLLAAALAAVAALAGARRAAADSPATEVKLEAGLELDTNPHRVETGNQLDPDSGSESWRDTSPAAVGRTGVRGALAWRLAPGRVLNATALVAGKKYAAGDVRTWELASGAGEPTLQETTAASAEDAFVVAADARADAALRSRGLVASARASYYDAFERDSFATLQIAERSFLRNVDRDFRTGDASIGLTVVGDGDHRVTALGGYRFFRFKPNRAFDFDGPYAGLAYRHRFLLGAPGEAEDDRTLAVSLQYLAHRRAFQGRSTNNVCPDGDELEPACRRDSPDLQRVDFFHAASAEIAYTGALLLGLRYEVHWNDSTSFGESLVRHRLEASATAELPAELYVTGRLVMQLNQFVDPLLLTGDVGTLVTIEDENRNAAMIHVMRELGERWALEARYGFFANEFATEALRFRRHTVYGGAVYSFRR